MPLVNALLVAFKDSCVYVTDAPSIALYGLRESYLELGTVESRDLAIEVAEAVLAVQSQRRATLVLDPLPRYAPDGFIAYQLGDTLATLGDQRVVGITISSDEDGRASVIPELRDRVAIEQEALDRLLRRVADGTMKGLTEQTTRATPSPRLAKPGRVKNIDTFSYDGALTDGLVSPPFNPPVPMQLTHIITNLRVAGSGPTGIRVVDQDGNVRASATIPSGRRLYAVDINPPEFVGVFNQLVVDVPTAGADAVGLTVQIQACTT
jgi:hypothetical protein